MNLRVIACRLCPDAPFRFYGGSFADLNSAQCCSRSEALVFRYFWEEGDSTKYASCTLCASVPQTYTLLRRDMAIKWGTFHITNSDLGKFGMWCLRSERYVCLTHPAGSALMTARNHRFKIITSWPRRLTAFLGSHIIRRRLKVIAYFNEFSTVQSQIIGRKK